jgi:DNA-binding CsgD family transcriptional regulator
LNWLKEGKTSWEISVILNKSERVVNFHINNVLKKLNAMNRTHAVVMAIKNNLIDL